MIPDRIERRIDRSGGPDACHPWVGNRGTKGRGTVYYDGRVYNAPRLTYMLTFGWLPREQFVCHHCDNPSCCNPNHLFVGTQKTNMADCASKGRSSRGVAHSRKVRRKLTEADVRQMRSLYREGVGPYEIARRFNVAGPTASTIVRGLRWAHVS